MKIYNKYFNEFVRCDRAGTGINIIETETVLIDDLLYPDIICLHEFDRIYCYLIKELWSHRIQINSLPIE